MKESISGGGGVIVEGGKGVRKDMSDDCEAVVVEVFWRGATVVRTCWVEGIG